MMAILTYLRVKFANKKGQGLVEYGLIIGIIAVVVVAALTLLKVPLQGVFERIGTYLTNQTPTTTSPTPGT